MEIALKWLKENKKVSQYFVDKNGQMDRDFRSGRIVRRHTAVVARPRWEASKQAMSE